MRDWIVPYILAGVAMAEWCDHSLRRNGPVRGGMYLMCAVAWPGIALFLAWFMWTNRRRG